MSDTPNWEQLTKYAKEFLSQMTAADEAATSRFDETMAAAMPSAKLTETWTTVQQQAGNYEGEGPDDEVRTNEEQGYHAVYLPVTFEKAPLFVKVVFKAEQIAGVQFVPNAPPKA